jgi:predicted flap endonuclease-1-like 5' DNA nuclease
MTLTGLSYLFSNFFWIWLLVALIGGIVWGWLTCDRSADASSRWFGPGFWVWVIVLAVGAVVAALKLVQGRMGLWFDTAVLFAATYFVGCCFGCVLRKIFSGEAAAPAVASAAAVAVAPPPPPAPALAAVRPYQWQAQKEGAAVTLTGYAPSNEVKSQIVDQATRVFGAGNVTDMMKLAAGAPAGLALMAGDSFGHLSKLDKGIGSLIDSDYTLTGQAPSIANKEAALSSTNLLRTGFRLAKADVMAPAPPPPPAPKPVPVAKPAPKPAPVKAEPPREPGRPVGLTGPRGGKADDLKRIRGIGKQNEGRLHGLGIWHFDQIAAWSKKEVEWVGNFLAFPGRIEREEWVEQAGILAKGGSTEFSKRVARGEVETSRDDGSRGQGNVEKAAAGQFGGGKRPKGLSAPRPGKKDDLKLINGVGRAIEAKLHAVGIYHFDQIAAMSDAELDWISTHVGFPGRAIRENWKGESAILASGGETDHSRAVKAGKIKTSLDDPDA